MILQKTLTVNKHELRVLPLEELHESLRDDFVFYVDPKVFEDVCEIGFGTCVERRLGCCVFYGELGLVYCLRAVDACRAVVDEGAVESWLEIGLYMSAYI